MSTPTQTRPGFGALLRSEWIKLSSVRSTWWTLGLMVVLGAGLTTISEPSWSPPSTPPG